MPSLASGAPPRTVRIARVVLHVVAIVCVLAGVLHAVVRLGEPERDGGAPAVLLAAASMAAVGVVVEVLAMRLRASTAWVRTALVAVMLATILLPWIGLPPMTIATIGLLVAIALLLTRDARRWFDAGSRAAR